MKSEAGQDRAAIAWQVDICDGLTKRDYFAAVALQGMLSSGIEHYLKAHVDSLACWAYEYADAMLEVGERGA